MRHLKKGENVNRQLKSVVMGLCVIFWFVGAAVTAADGPAAPESWVHPGAAVMSDNGFEGPQTCGACHPDALDQITHSVHWYVSSEVRNVKGLPNGTWWGMVNRECALAGTTALANWTASTDGHFTAQSAGCGMCHIAGLTGPPLPPGRDASEAEAATVDCLVCHAERYDMTARMTLVKDEAGRARWGQDHSLAAALSITEVPTAEACLRCHEHSFSRDYKRGTPYEPTTDVHAAAGMPCTSCHVTREHLIAKGQNESDMVANDLPDVPVACSSCHGHEPHRGAEATVLNAHTTRVACQTCHIPAVGGIVREDWGQPVKDDGSGLYSALSKYDGIPAIADIWVPSAIIDRGAPNHMWRVANTAEARDAQSWMAFATSTRSNDDAAIFPVRELTQILLFDRTVKMWQAPGMSFVKDQPGMVDFPLLLAPNREVYNATGDVAAAIAAGVKPAEAMGLHWSGQWMSMQVPGTSYISVNHGVRRIGFACRDCHSPHGVLDFTALGYPPEEVEGLQKPR
jgi:hypothetical protein